MDGTVVTVKFYVQSILVRFDAHTRHLQPHHNMFEHNNLDIYFNGVYTADIVFRNLKMFHFLVFEYDGSHNNSRTQQRHSQNTIRLFLGRNIYHFFSLSLVSPLFVLFVFVVIFFHSFIGAHTEYSLF